ncbi:MAG TPA: biopolymer transporter ExbD [Steroidobacteraceae bacterium]|nr:biopolymer transporter ExbD [Steroidobacteraceae bacterium]
MGSPLSSLDETPLADINLTPLIDVFLVLLIVLLLALPITTHKTTMDLGNGPGAKREAITIDIGFDGSIYWNGEVVSGIPTLEQFFRATAKDSVQPDVRINADRSARYEVVAQVMAAAQRNHIERIGFAGQERFAE